MRHPAIHYDGEKPADLLAEDRAIGALNLSISAERITVTPIADYLPDDARAPRSNS